MEVWGAGVGRCGQGFVMSGAGGRGSEDGRSGGCGGPRPWSVEAGGREANDPPAPNGHQERGGGGGGRMEQLDDKTREEAGAMSKTGTLTH